jgi:hypothetical protein
VSVFVQRLSSEDSINGVGSGIDATLFVDTMNQGRPTANGMIFSTCPLVFAVDTLMAAMLSLFGS